MAARRNARATRTARSNDVRHDVRHDVRPPVFAVSFGDMFEDIDDMSLAGMVLV